jgi:CubicO group peptidase (beta-lactamase class C family)
VFPGASRRTAKTPRRRWEGIPQRLPRLAVFLLLPLLVAGCDSPERSKGEPVPQPGSASFGEDRVEPGTVGGPDREGDGSLLDARHLPATSGLDSTLLASAVERAGGQSRLHNMMVARHGEVILERHFRGPPPHQPANVKSVSKTLLSAVVGYALAEGVLEDLDTPVSHYFPDYLPPEEEAEVQGGGDSDRVGTTSPGAEDDLRRQITLAHLLSMSSGLESTSIRNYGRWVSSPNWVRAALTRPMNFPPGTRMVYSTGNSHLLSAVLTRASDRTTHALARAALSESVGIQLPPWPRDPQGIYFGGNDMLISPRDLLRFGELYRQGGTLDGREALPREWVTESWRVRIHSPRDGNGYGLGWWARNSGPHEVRFAWGYGGQFLFIVPSLELTVVFTSDPWASREGNHLRVLHDLLDDYLVPAAERGAQG